MIIRRATVADAESIIRVHYDAVHRTASADYDAQILEDWSSSQFDERIQKMNAQLAHNPDNATMIVAEVDGCVVGFGEVVPALQELRAVYVCSTAARAGVGRALLSALEESAREQGAKSLWLDSSLTAEHFYRARGFQPDNGVTESLHELRSGRQMRCIKMHKSL